MDFHPAHIQCHGLDFFFFIMSFYSSCKSFQCHFCWQMLLRTDLFLFSYSWIGSNIFFHIAQVSTMELLLDDYSEKKIVVIFVTFFSNSWNIFCMCPYNLLISTSCQLQGSMIMNSMKNFNANKGRERKSSMWSLFFFPSWIQWGVETCRAFFSGFDKNLSHSYIKC